MHIRVPTHPYSVSNFNNPDAESQKASCAAYPRAVPDRSMQDINVFNYD